jgi:hypothetical protein
MGWVSFCFSELPQKQHSCVLPILTPFRIKFSLSHKFYLCSKAT